MEMKDFNKLNKLYQQQTGDEAPLTWTEIGEGIFSTLLPQELALLVNMFDKVAEHTNPRFKMLSNMIMMGMNMMHSHGAYIPKDQRQNMMAQAIKNKRGA